MGRGIALALGVMAAGASWAQWTVTRLHPGSGQDSYALSAGGTRQGGYVLQPSNKIRAAVWNSSANSFIDLNPGTWDGRCYGTSGSQQVGVYNDKAALWSGTSQSYVNLNPSWASYSMALGIAGGVQVGYAGTGGPRAGMWHGSAATWQYFNSPGITSYAYATDGAQHVGRFDDSACVWSSDGSTCIDLSPPGSTASIAYAVSGGKQGGFATFAGVERAGIWTGTPGSWNELDPAGSQGSNVLAMAGSVQVGFVRLSGYQVAALWAGSFASFVNLNSYLPVGYGAGAVATGVWIDNGVTFISGWARNNLSGREEAVLWRSPALPSAVTGVVGLNDVVWNPGYSRTITVRVKQGATTLASRSIPVGTVAAVSLNVPGAGNAEVTIDGPTQLLRRRAVFLDGNPIDLGVVVLNNGDTDGSGEVDAADIDVVIAQFGQTSGSLGDVDLSGEVDAADIDIIIANFGAVDE